MKTHGVRPSLLPASVLPVALCLVCNTILSSPLHAADFEPAEGGNHRRIPLIVPHSGNTGFTQLPPDATGVHFTNRLSDEALAANQILEIGSGVALGDIDGDGWTDIYLCSLEGPNRWYRNLGDWRFEDVTATTGSACEGQFSTGALLADIDGDGDLDLFVNSIGGGTRLFLNDGKGHFTERPDAGLDRRGGATTLTAADIDGDGFLDIYSANYHARTVKDRPGFAIDIREVNGRIQISPPGLFLPIHLKNGGISLFERGQEDFLYRNLGNGRFAAISWTEGAFRTAEGAALTEAPKDWGLMAAFRDLNGDRLPDLFVCNDFFNSPDHLWINTGAAEFQALSSRAVRQISMSSMAVDFADINRDGHDDILVVDMMSRDHQRRHRQRGSLIHLQAAVPVSDPDHRPEYPRNTLFLNRGDGTYAEIAQLAGLDASEWSWSVIFLDVDLDGFEDVLVTNGTLRDANDADFTSATGPLSRQNANLRFARLETPNLLFHNQGNLRFIETGEAWGFAEPGISHGMAVADLDNDGDLDVVINNVHAPAGLYRNNTPAPRLAIRLKGSPPNTRGIGARILITGGSLPPQSQEVISGGRYLSSDDPLRVFAAGETNPPISIQVLWRSGRTSIVHNAIPNSLYEIFEPDDPPASHSIDSAPPPAPWFEDISEWLEHPHTDDGFNDLTLQPLLPIHLSTLGPGVCWYDVDGDGWDDLMIGAGRRGDHVLYRNNRGSGFTPLRRRDPVPRDQTAILARTEPDGVRITVGMSNYKTHSVTAPSVLEYNLLQDAPEQELAATRAATGPLSLGFIDGRRVLFVGGRVAAGRYPESVSSRIYAWENGRWLPHPEMSAALERVGMVSGTTWSDLDGDGIPELILACDWGPLRVFKAAGNRLIETTAELGLADHRGRWTSVITADFNGDGVLEIVAGNWGANSKYQRHRRHPVRLYYGDWNNDGRIEMLESYFDESAGGYVPFQTLDTLRESMPRLARPFSSFKDYASATIDRILAEHLEHTAHLEINLLETSVFEFRDGRYHPTPLPDEAQFSPVFGLSAGDFNGDGNEDLFLGQNFFAVEPNTSRHDAGLGLWLRGAGAGGFKAVPASESGIRIHGEQRGTALCDFDRDGRVDLVVAQYRGPSALFRNIRAKPGLRVRLRGPEANIDGFGAVIRLVFKNRMGPARVVEAGSGYWSQSGSTQILGLPEEAEKVWVRWPGGGTTIKAIPKGSSEITVSADEESAP